MEHSNLSRGTSEKIDVVMDLVPDICTENLADAKYSSCSAKARPKINVDVPIVHEGQFSEIGKKAYLAAKWV